MLAKNEQAARRWSVYAVLLGGLVLLSFAAPMVKELLDLGLGYTSMTFYRVAISTVLVWMLIASKRAYRDEVRSATRREYRLFVLNGFFRGLNMTLWVMALQYTPIFLADALMRTNPIWVIAGSYVFLGKQTPLKSLVGVAVCLGGIALAAWGGATDANTNATGILILLFNAVLFGMNVIVLSLIREKFSLWPTMGMSFLFATVLVFIACLVTGSAFGPVSVHAWVLLGLLAAFPTLLAQSSTAYALEYLSATTVSLISLLAPFISGVTAFLLRGEVPTALTVLGAAVMALGLALYFRAGASYAKGVSDRLEDGN